MGILLQQKGKAPRFGKKQTNVSVSPSKEIRKEPSVNVQKSGDTKNEPVTGAEKYTDGAEQKDINTAITSGNKDESIKKEKLKAKSSSPKKDTVSNTKKGHGEVPKKVNQKLIPQKPPHVLIKQKMLHFARVRELTKDYFNGVNLHFKHGAAISKVKHARRIKSVGLSGA